MAEDDNLQEGLYPDLDAPGANEEVAELDQQQMLQMMFQQNQMIIQWMKEGGKGGKGGFAKGHGKEPAQVMKPTAAPAFGGAGYEAWRKRVREWESVHFALHPMQKAGAVLSKKKEDKTNRGRQFFAA